MRRFPKILGLLVMAIFYLCISVLADDMDGWKYSKEVVYGNSDEVKAIYLDEEVYSHANKDLSDIRLINKKDEFIPYYIYNSFLSRSTKEQEVYLATEILSFMKNNDYYVDYQINSKIANTDIIANLLMLDIAEDNFYKEIKVLGSYDNKNWENIMTDIVYSVNGQNKTELALGDDYKYLYYRMISLSDTSGIPINGVKLVYDHVESSYEIYNRSKTIGYELEIDKEAKETNVKIPNKEGLRISNIKIKSKDEFNRDYKVYASNEEWQKEWQIAQGKIYKFKLEEFQAQDLNITLQETMEEYISPEYLQIVISDNDNNPINIDEIEVEYHVDKIVFKTKDADGIRLLFGNELAGKPSYDISSYIMEIEKSKQEIGDLLQLENRGSIAIPKTNIDFKLVLNISIVMISGLLVAIIIKKR